MQEEGKGEKGWLLNGRNFRYYEKVRVGKKSEDKT